jgi:hypothetical protein
VVYKYELRRDGHAFLVLPTSPSLAAETLNLYPAQTWLARLMRWALRQWLNLRLPLPYPRVACEIDENSSLWAFWVELAATPEPEFGILCGNHRSPAQRFIALVFGPQREIVGVVKSAHTSEGRSLIEREADFLESCSTVQGIPRLRGRLENEQVQAFALEFVRGEPPQANDIAGLARTLGLWIDLENFVELENIPMWRHLPPCADISRVGMHRVHPAIFHGDFAPWNIRVFRGNWVVLDWERGEKIGVPTWDWFHFELQHAILVRRLSTPALLTVAETILARPEFHRYAKTAGVLGHERSLFLAYLNYAIEVLRPTEGLETLRQLRRSWSERHRAQQTG